MTEEYWNSYIDHLIEVMKSIEPHKVTILTGRNGGGKSMIRKLLAQFLMMKDELKNRNRNHLVASISMDMRAGIDPNRGFQSMFDRDIEWIPTSENTFDSIERILKQTDRYIVLDELELGMGEELQAGLGQYINSKLDQIMSQNLGLLIITHSREMVRRLKHDQFINLEGMSEEEWLNREVIPMSPEELHLKSNELYKALDKRLKTA